MRRKRFILLVSVAIISFIGFMKNTFKHSVNYVTLAERFLGLEAKRGGVKNSARFFVQIGSLKVA